MSPSIGVVLRLVRIDARRPISWLIAVAAAATTAIVPSDPAPVAVWCGVLLATAAVGGLFHDVAVADLVPLRGMARLVWPIAGIVVGALVATAFGRDTVAVTACTVAAGSVGALGIGWLVRRRGGSLTGRRIPEAAAMGSPQSVGRSWLDGIAMATTLAAMAICFFLAPQAAGWYAVVVAGWFTLLAVPTATLAGGDEAARRMLLATVVGRPRLPGTVVRSLGLLAAYAGVFCWPAAVAALLSREAVPIGGPLAALAAIALLATLAAAAALVGPRCRWREDAPLVLVAAAHAVAVAALARVA